MASSEIKLKMRVDPAREEALALADQYVTAWTEQTKNSRGYVHDKWTPVEIQTRTEAVLRVAGWLLQGVLVAPDNDTAPPATDDPRDVAPGY